MSKMQWVIEHSSFKVAYDNDRSHADWFSKDDIIEVSFNETNGREYAELHISRPGQAETCQFHTIKKAGLIRMKYSDFFDFVSFDVSRDDGTWTVEMLYQKQYPEQSPTPESQKKQLFAFIPIENENANADVPHHEHSGGSGGGYAA